MKKRNLQPSTVDIKVVTWEKQSHGLFDYQSKSLKQKHYTVQNSCSLVQYAKDMEVGFVSQSSVKNTLIESPGTVLLGAIDVNNHAEIYSFRNNFKTVFGNSNNKIMEVDGRERPQPFLVVRSLKNAEGEQKGYALKIGDVIKFGRLQYTVLEYRDDSKTYTHGSLGVNFQTHFAQQKLEGCCKICLSEEQDEKNNFLVSPCQCKGSCQFIHLLCLKQWIQSKICKQNHGIVETYNFTKYQCQICKTAFPQRVVRGNQSFEMLIISKPLEPYIILESTSDKEVNGKTIYLITNKKGANVKLGRGHQCQIRMSDISVSRVHAEMNYKGNKFIIFDNSSKFGTLIKLSTNYPLSNQRCAIQIGRTVMICTVKLPQLKDFISKKPILQEYSFKTISNNK